jgi:RNA polymerase sigma-70 factor (ECF subfamily)
VSDAHDANRAAATAAARSSYSRLVAYLAQKTGDVATAEDALSEALEAALTQWPGDGVPDRPESWLLTVAHRRFLDRARRRSVRDNSEHTVRQVLTELEDARGFDDEIPDRRLGLLFACAHPAIAPNMRSALMLQAVLGLDAATIGSHFLVKPATMAQRLVRLKRKISAANIPFEVPDLSRWPQRVDDVLEAVYGAYTSGWETPTHVSGSGLVSESIWLAQLLVDLLPDNPEAKGLLALILHCEARRDARRDDQGRFVPLDEQDPARWRQAMMDEAERLLRIASEQRVLGAFQLEASIQSVHAQRRYGEPVRWHVIVALYDGLIAITDSIGARVGRASAIGHALGPESGLEALDEISSDAISSYQPYWAVRAHFLEQLGRDANHEFDLAIGLSDDPAVRDYLRQKRTE